MKFVFTLCRKQERLFSLHKGNDANSFIFLTRRYKNGASYKYKVKRTPGDYLAHLKGRPVT